MGKLPWRGCGVEGLAGCRPDAARIQTVSARVQDERSLVGGDEGMGACGRSRRREHEGPEHGRSRRGAEWEVPPSRNSSNSGSDVPVDWLNLEVT